MSTCGTGLADHAAFPAKLGQWSAALADVLEAHTMAIDLDDPVAHDEIRAYVSLVNRFRELAAELRATANEMSADRRLAMPRHDRSVLGGERARDAFRGFVERERELHALLRTELARDERQLSDLLTKRDT
jgi:hypothetical protein